MSVPVLTAVTGAVWEADLVSELDRADHGLTVVRRCIDLAELLSAAAAGTAKAALLSWDLRRLDRDAVVRLAAAGVAVVGLVDPGDLDSERRLRQLGVVRVLGADAGAAAISAAVLEAVSEADPASARTLVGDPRAALPMLLESVSAPPTRHGDGRVVAVWGPTGAPGRTTVAVGLADEIARLGQSTLLVDADVYGGVVAQVLGLLDESPGVAAACRLAGNGMLDAEQLLGVARAVRPGFSVLTGISRADRWPELRPSSVGLVLDQARHCAAHVVVDCGFSLEQDEEVMFDTMAPRRNGTTLAVLHAADTVLCVGGADPVAVQRLVRAVGELQETMPARTPVIVVNRVRRVVVPGDPQREIAAALLRYAAVASAEYLPYDRAGSDLALSLGKTLGEAAPSSPLRLALASLARRVAGMPAQSSRREQRRSLLLRR